MGHGRPMVLIHKADGCGPKLQLQMICNRHEELQKLQTFCPWHLSGNPDFSLINFVNRSWLRGTDGKENLAEPSMEPSPLEPAGTAPNDP